jgi:hypothetical protein
VGDKARKSQRLACARQLRVIELWRAAIQFMGLGNFGIRLRKGKNLDLSWSEGSQLNACANSEKI